MTLRALEDASRFLLVLAGGGGGAGCIVVESFALGAVVSEVARWHEMSPQRAEGDCREAARSSAAVDHDRDGWGGGSSRMRRGCGVTVGCAARGEGSVMIVPSGAVRILTATQRVDFRKGMEGSCRIGAREALVAIPTAGDQCLPGQARRPSEAQLPHFRGLTARKAHKCSAFGASCTESIFRGALFT